MIQLDSFETTLLQALHEHAAEVRHEVEPSTPTPIRRSPKRRFYGVAAGIAASAAAAVAVTVGVSGPEPAFALSTASDGDIVVTIHQLSDAAGLEQALRDRGVDVDVNYHAGDVCAAPPAGGSGGGDASGPDVSMDPGHNPTDLPKEPPATLSRSGDDWTLRIPAESVLKDTHFTLQTSAAGQLAVGWQLPGGASAVLEPECKVG